MTTLLWLRDDLRLADHEALTAACADVAAGGTGVVAVWIREETAPDDDQVSDDDATDAVSTGIADAGATAVPGRLGPRPLGAATRWWYHRSLQALAARLADLGVPLVFARGDARVLVPELASGLGARVVRWQRRYAVGARAVDAAIKHRLTDTGIAAHSHPGALLVEPWTLQTGSGGFYTVFTPFHRAAAERDVAPPLPVPDAVPAGGGGVARAIERLTAAGRLCSLDALELLDRRPEWWRDTVALHWTPGEEAAHERLAALEDWLPDYRTTRDEPADDDATSRLSPRLRSGELSPRTVLHAAETADVPPADRQAWIRQLYWREFCWHLTYHLPDLDRRPLREAFDAFPYVPDAALADAWRAGRTGIDLVDAGMRQLWLSGWMHNRVRMVTASLFTKNLLQPWWEGEEWFWDTLVDADEANNPVSWQWVAGCGADAAPYFRVFNPDLQRDKFDPQGSYVARWLAGHDRPATPVVDLKESRRAALDAYGAIKGAPGASSGPLGPTAS